MEIGGLTGAVSRLVGEPLRPMPPTESHAKFRITLAGDVGRAKVHVDSSHWSGILYLSRPEDCQGGTAFFRHIPTNTERAPYDDRSEAHTSELPSLMSISYAVFCLKKQNHT